jgi:hypothetical protein
MLVLTMPYLSNYNISSSSQVLWEDGDSYDVSIIRNFDNKVVIDFPGYIPSGYSFIIDSPDIQNGIDLFYIQLKDVLGNLVNSPLFNFIVTPLSNICFVKGTLIQTDQGILPIETCTHHTIQNKNFKLTETVSRDTHLVSIEKHAFGKLPHHTTILSCGHKLMYQNKLCCARELVNHTTITLIPYKKEILYNVLLSTHTFVNVHGLLCETLDPKSRVATVFKDVVLRDKTAITQHRERHDPVSILDFFKQLKT